MSLIQIRICAGPWQVMLKQADGSYSCVAESVTRFLPLGRKKMLKLKHLLIGAVELAAASREAHIRCLLKVKQRSFTRVFGVGD
ncbi:hypothetical protein Peur_019646 [Populus x canadensis]